MLGKSLRFLALLSPLLGCASFDEAVVGQVSQEGRVINGRVINGRVINGRVINGRVINGSELGAYVASVRLDGVELAGRVHDDVGLVAGELSAPDVSGEGFAGAVLESVLSDGSILPLRVEAIFPVAPDLLAYQVTYDTDEGPVPLCVNAEGQALVAYALDGVWSHEEGRPGGGARKDVPGHFTFACAGAALGKCVEAGYVPWRTVAGKSLEPYHDACTRMVRADYCGDGRPGTLNGWSIDVHDDLGVQTSDARGENWVFEAAWTTNGAACVDEYRALELVVSGDVPECTLERVNRDCQATPFGRGVVLKSSYDSAGVVALVEQLLRVAEGQKLAFKVEQALGALEAGFALLSHTAPDRAAAVDQFVSAMGHLDTAVSTKLIPYAYGRGLQNRIAGVSRHLAVAEFRRNACFPRNPFRLLLASAALAQGEILRVMSLAKSAGSQYGNAIDHAYAAAGRPCY